MKPFAPKPSNLSSDEEAVAVAATGASAGIIHLADARGGFEPYDRLHAIRRHLLVTLQAMATSPLQLRQRHMQCLGIAERAGSPMWPCFCSVCGLRFEHIQGSVQLAAHAGGHVVHERLQRMRRDDIPTMLQDLRAATASNVTSIAGARLRQELEQARRVSRVLPDAGLQRVLQLGEARLRAVERSRVPARSANAAVAEPSRAGEGSKAVGAAPGLLPSAQPAALAPVEGSGSAHHKVDRQ